MSGCDAFKYLEISTLPNFKWSKLKFQLFSTFQSKVPLYSLCYEVRNINILKVEKRRIKFFGKFLQTFKKNVTEEKQ